MPYKDYQKKLERERERYLANKEDKKAYHKEYAKNNREKINERSRELKREKKQILIEHLGGKCVGCGVTTDLQFDHIDRNAKSFTIGKCLGNKLEDLIKEANKCQLLCKSCHEYKTTINHDTNMLASGYKVKEVRKVGDEIVVTLHQPAHPS